MENSVLDSIGPREIGCDLDGNEAHVQRLPQREESRIGCYSITISGPESIWSASDFTPFLVRSDSHPLSIDSRGFDVSLPAQFVNNVVTFGTHKIVCTTEPLRNSSEKCYAP